MQEIQPEIKEIQKKYKDDKEQQAKKLMAFYKEKKVNPLAGCLPLIVQLIILIGIYQILLNLSNTGPVIEEKFLYSFIDNPGEVNHSFLGLIDLSVPSPILAVLAAIAQYFQVKMLMKSKKDEGEEKKKKKDSEQADPMDFAQTMTKQMVYIAPAITLIIGFTFAAGLSLYWLVSTLFMIVQQHYIIKKSEENPGEKTS
jgi:YidC/Oxa1 family membrane protein insertase